MERPSVSHSILAGLLATLAMTFLMYLAPTMGMPKMDIAAMLGSMLGSWWMGMLAHFVNGTIVFPLVYAYLLYAVLPGWPWLKGTLLGLILWFVAQVVVMPMMGMGMFSAKASAPALLVMGSFIGHFVYGTLLGAIAGECRDCLVVPAGMPRTSFRKAD